MNVKSNLPNNQVALWERHPAHPGGEVYIAGDEPVEVGDTPAVRSRLKTGVLIEVRDAQSVRPPVLAETVSAMTVDSVVAAVIAGDMDASDVLEAERQGKNRTSLITKLEAMIDGNSD